MEVVGLTAHRHVPAGVLGYAEQRTLEIAVTIAAAAAVLLFDEPTTNEQRRNRTGCGTRLEKSLTDKLAFMYAARTCEQPAAGVGRELIESVELGHVLVDLDEPHPRVALVADEK